MRFLLLLIQVFLIYRLYSSNALLWLTPGALMSKQEVKTERFECAVVKRTVILTKTYAILQGNNGAIVEKALSGRTCSGQATCNTILGQLSCPHPEKAPAHP